MKCRHTVGREFVLITWIMVVVSNVTLNHCCLAVELIELDRIKFIVCLEIESAC